MTVGDRLQLLGLAVNGGLLIGLIFQIRWSTKARRDDLLLNRQRATLEAWGKLVDSIRDAEVQTRRQFGRGRITEARAMAFIEEVQDANQRRTRDSPVSTDFDASAIVINEALRALLNLAEDFAVAIEMGIYDRETALRVGGWRLARVVDRHLGYINVVRSDMNVSSVYETVERLSREFVERHGLTLGELPLLFASDPTPSTDPPG